MTRDCNFINQLIPARSTKTLGRDAKHDSSLPNLQRPRSLFERPTAISQPNTIPLSTASSLAYGFQIDRDGRLINKAGIPVGQPYARSPTVPIPIPRPNPESQGDQVDWLVHEEWALLQVSWSGLSISNCQHFLILHVINAQC